MANLEELSEQQFANDDRQTCFLRAMAKRYIWWQSADEVLKRPSRVIVQVMDIGTFEDAQELQDVFGIRPLQIALQSSGPGQLRGKSWSYWHYRLNITPIDQAPPPMPVRTFA